MEAMRQNWTDDRLDDLSRRMDKRFDQVDQRFDRVEGEMKAGFARVDSRFAGIDGKIEACEIQLARINEGQGRNREAVAELHADSRQLHADLHALERTIAQVGFGLAFTLVVTVVGLLIGNL
jgi:septation ring formation regulator EzrA